MKKRIAICFISLLLLAFAFQTVCYADEPDYAGELYGSLPSLAQNALPDGITQESVSERTGIKGILLMITDSLSGQLTDSRPLIITMLSLCVLGSLVSSVCEGLSCKKNADFCISIALAASLCTILLPTVDGIVSYLSDMSVLMNALAPISAAILISGASVTAGAASSAGMSAVAAITDRLCVDVLTPISVALLGFSICDCMGGRFRASAISGYIKKAYLTLIGFMCTVISFSMGMQSAIAASADSLGARSLKFVVGSSLPMVGSTVSASLSTLGASLSVIKSTVGAGAVIATLAIALPSLFYIFVIRFSLSLCAGVSSLSGSVECERVFRSFFSLFDMLLAVVALTAVTAIIVISIFIKNSPAIGG